MLHAVKSFLKIPATKIGIATAIAFQLIFSIVWMTGYDGVTDNVKKLGIAIVNEDQQMGVQVAKQLAGSLPFQVKQMESSEEAAKELDSRSIQMIVTIPKDFSAKLAAPGQKAEIEYAINESNPALIKSAMTQVTGTVTSIVNKQATTVALNGVLSKTGMPADQVKATADSLSERVVSKVESVHPVKGMANQMVPMMMVLASYVGAMIMGMNMEQASMALGGTIGRWRKFAARSIINVFAAILVSLIGTLMILALGGQSEHGFLLMWLFEGVFVLTFMFVAQFFLLLLGVPGMLLNIIMLSVQLVTSGAMVPRELLSDFYHSISTVLPATYAVDGGMNILFGGPGISGDISALLLIMLMVIVISVLVVPVRKEKKSASTANRLATVGE